MGMPDDEAFYAPPDEHVPKLKRDPREGGRMSAYRAEELI